MKKFSIKKPYLIAIVGSFIPVCSFFFFADSTLFEPFFNSSVVNGIIKYQGCTLHSGDPTKLSQIFRLIKSSHGYNSTSDSIDK